MSRPPITVAYRKQIIFIVVLITLRVGWFVFGPGGMTSPGRLSSADVAKMRAHYEEEKRQAKEQHMQNAAQVRKAPVAQTTQIINRYAAHTWIVGFAGGPYLRIGIQADLDLTTARKVAVLLGGRCLSEDGAAATVSCPAATAIALERKLHTTLSSCPAAADKTPAQQHILIREGGDKYFLTCTPLAACQKFEGGFSLQLQGAPAANARTLGEVFDLMWPEKICAPPAPAFSRPLVVEKVFVTSA